MKRTSTGRHAEGPTLLPKVVVRLRHSPSNATCQSPRHHARAATAQKLKARPGGQAGHPAVGLGASLHPGLSRPGGGRTVLSRQSKRAKRMATTLQQTYCSRSAPSQEQGLASLEWRGLPHGLRPSPPPPPVLQSGSPPSTFLMAASQWRSLEFPGRPRVRHAAAPPPTTLPTGFSGPSFSLVLAWVGDTVLPPGCPGQTALPWCPTAHPSSGPAPQPPDSLLDLSLCSHGTATEKTWKP